eukprot:8310917-Heterocapsa_arctica.AAC.1
MERKEQDKKKMAWAIYEMHEAERKQDIAMVHRMVRLLAGKGTGPRRRVYKTPPTQCPSTEEWRE